MIIFPKMLGQLAVCMVKMTSTSDEEKINTRWILDLNEKGKNRK